MRKKADLSASISPAGPAVTLSVTDAEEKKRLEKVARFVPVYAARMLPALAKAMIYRALVEVPLPPLVGTMRPGFKVGDRLFYREWVGGPTGRADLLTIREITRDGTHAIVWRSWSWLQGKIDDDLSELALRVDTTGNFPLLDYSPEESA